MIKPARLIIKEGDSEKKQAVIALRSSSNLPTMTTIWRLAQSVKEKTPRQQLRVRCQLGKRAKLH